MTKFQIWRVYFGKNNEDKTFSGSIQAVVDKSYIYRETHFEGLSKEDRADVIAAGDFDITKIELIAETDEE